VLIWRGARRVCRLGLLTGHAWLGLIAFDVARLAGFARVHDWVTRRRPSATRRRSRATVDDIVWAVDEACVWYVRRAACLQRSVVATWLLRHYGLEAALVIGCRPLPFESHAWVEVDGRIVNDRPQYQKFFTVLDRL
jgi:transglutaminase superfamily protein